MAAANDARPLVGTERAQQEQEKDDVASITQSGPDQRDDASNTKRTTTFGPYTAHPVAALFPLLRDVDDSAFAELVCSIRDVCGLLDPIVLDGNVILDGRSRYLACAAAGVKPRFVQFADLDLGMSAHEYAFEHNYTRRHLTDDQRTAITAEFLRFDDEEVKRQQAEAGKQGAAHGKEGGRGKKKPPPQDSGEGVPSHKRATHTLEKVATSAKVSKHKAQQAINVTQRGSDDLKHAVRSGKVSLAQAQAMLASSATDSDPAIVGSRIRRALSGHRLPPTSAKTHVVKTLRRLVTLLTRTAPDVVARDMKPNEMEQVQLCLAEFDRWADAFVRNLPSEPARQLSTPTTKQAQEAP